MSWQASAWAAEQVTGSPQAKLILLLLANRANEDGVCWPSQINLADQSEQSADTVQRHLKRLEEGHLIRRARSRRTRGRWPGFVYQLLMPGVAADDGLLKRPAQKRARKAATVDPVTGRPSLAAAEPAEPAEPHPAAWTEPHPAAWTEPHTAASPGRSQRLHRAAVSGVESSIEPSLQTSAYSNHIIESNLKAPTTPISIADRSKALQERKQAREDLIQDRVARRLGTNGWIILQAMKPDQLAQIVLLERRGHLSDRDLDNIRGEACLAHAGAIKR
jgi:hypothetical protein